MWYLKWELLPTSITRRHNTHTSVSVQDNSMNYFLQINLVSFFPKHSSAEDIIGSKKIALCRHIFKIFGKLYFEVIHLTPLRVDRCSSLGIYLKCLLGLFNSCKETDCRIIYSTVTLLAVSEWMSTEGQLPLVVRRVVLSDVIWGVENCCLFFSWSIVKVKASVCPDQWIWLFS